MLEKSTLVLAEVVPLMDLALGSLMAWLEQDLPGSIEPMDRTDLAHYCLFGQVGLAYGVPKFYSTATIARIIATENMEKKIDYWLKQILLVLFHFGAVTLPLVFTFNTDELFEFNKMLFVYGWVSIALALWFARMVVRRQMLFAKTPLDLPIIGFLITQLVSTIFSIHPYTSLYGYYSRFHGGLLSTLSYIGLYYVFISTFWSEEDNAPKPLLQRPVVKWLLSAGLGITLASLYAFPEHFGHSISCQLATNSFNVSCWVQDVQNRVFGTFGQPNWLAAYLIMLIPLALGSRLEQLL